METRIPANLSKLQILSVIAGVVLIACLAACAYLIGFQPDHNKRLAEMLSQAANAGMTGDKQSAERKYEQAIVEAKQCSGKSKLPLILSQLAQLYVADNKLQLAEESSRNSVIAYKSMIDSADAGSPYSKTQDQRDYAIEMGRLAQILCKEGKFSEAAPFYKDAISENSNAAGSLEVFENLKHDYANCLRKAGKDNVADLSEADVDSDFLSSPGWAAAQEEGEKLFLEGKFDAADQQFKSTYIAAARQGSWKLAVSCLWRGISLLSKGDSVGAEKELQQSVQTMPPDEKGREKIKANADAWAFLAYAQMLNGKGQDSVHSYRSALNLFPGVSRDFDILGDAYLHLSKPEQQKHLYDWILQQEISVDGAGSPGLLMTLERLGLACLQRGNPAKAKLLFSRAEKLKRINPTQIGSEVFANELAEEFSWLSGELTHKKRSQDAEMASRNAVALASRPATKVFALCTLGQALVAQSKFPAASEEINKGLQIAKKDRSPELIGLAASQLGNLAMGQKNVKEAEQYYQQAASVTENRNDCLVSHSQYMLTLGALQCDLGMEQAGEATLKKAFALEAAAAQHAPLSVALQKLATLEHKRKHYQLAEQLYKKAADVSADREECQPIHIESLVYLGQLQREQNENAAATSTFEEAIAASKKSGDYLLVSLRILLADAKRATEK